MSRSDLGAVVTHLNIYRRLGFTPIPLRGKTPLKPWKNYEYDVMDFVAPGVNIGVKAGAISLTDWAYFIDIDDKALIGDFYAANPLLLGAPLVSTGRGYHLYLSWKELVKTRVFPWGELRGEGTYCVAPLSVHPSGHIYKFIIPLKGLPLTYDPNSLDFAPGETHNQSIVLNALACSAQEEPTQAHQQYNNYSLVGVPKGQRHNTLVKKVSFLLSNHFTEEETLARALDWNTHNKPPISNEEVKQTVRSCYEQWDVYTGG